MNSTRVSNGLDPYQDQHSIGSDLDPNCLQRLSANDKQQSLLARKEFNLKLLIFFEGILHKF